MSCNGASSKLNSNPLGIFFGLIMCGAMAPEFLPMCLLTNPSFV